MANSILTYFKKKNVNDESVNSEIVNSRNLCVATNSEKDVNNVNSASRKDSSKQNDSMECERPCGSSNEKNVPKEAYHPPKGFVFPKTKFGKRERSCQHNWFESYPWLHYDSERDCVLCFYCMNNLEKLTAEKNKELTYISTGFRKCVSAFMW